ncbi:hypothetical protein [Jiangella sp. DSM 45060]|uniref:hypothetical protein n=1 Tax=Jiangella sp. DSM 45060 TaxID=1798224 RepID=UPI00087DD207|nr:hypothetical protein [Jiangella sp. DSM 45060]SDT45721.1 hypothetical protein SAMN04515669_4147 [Jiangella sp. DSM 45060]
MNTATRVALAAATGYILGRRKRLKLAIAVGSMLAGKRLATDPRGMLRQAGELVESRPELAQLTDQVRTTLYTAARGAAVGVVGQRIDQLSDSIRDRSDRLTGAVTERTPISGGRDSDEAEDVEDVEEEPAKEEPAEEEAAEEEPAEEKRPRKRAAKKAPAKRSASSRKESSRKEKPARKRAAKKTASSGRSRAGSGR